MNQSLVTSALIAVAFITAIKLGVDTQNLLACTGVLVVIAVLAYFGPMVWKASLPEIEEDCDQDCSHRWHEAVAFCADCGAELYTIGTLVNKFELKQRIRKCLR